MSAPKSEKPRKGKAAKAGPEKPKGTYYTLPDGTKKFIPEGYEVMWGKVWKVADYPVIKRHMAVFRYGNKHYPQAPPREEHFKAIVEWLWGKQNRRKQFVWHPWAEQMLTACCEQADREKGYLAVAGAGSTGKSAFAAVWAIVNFIVAPQETMVLLTSTGLKDARKRIWGTLLEFWRGSLVPLPGKIRDSQGSIVFAIPGVDNTPTSDKSGISLIAADKSKAKEAAGKLIGFKNSRVILIADELSELDENLMGAAYSNLSKNPYFQLIGLSNPASYYDPFGVLAKPKAGWDSISLKDYEWETERGRAIRFDGEDTPNLLGEKPRYPFLITQADIERDRQTYGEKSALYYRMCRGYWSPTGAVDGIYSEADIVKFRADQSAVWLKPPVVVAALDPAYTNGGDRSALYFGKFGETRDGIPTLGFTKCLFLSDDINKKDTPRSFQIIQQFKELCEKEGVLPENACFDATGAGKPFGDIIAREWSPKVRRVEFGGKASSEPSSVSDPTPGYDRYANRVSEIWFGAKELMRAGQIKGVSESLGKELCSRTYSTKKGSNALLMAEPKSDMRARVGHSPDEADAALMLVVLCKERFSFGTHKPSALNRPLGQVFSAGGFLRKLAFVGNPKSLSV